MRDSERPADGGEGGAATFDGKKAKAKWENSRTENGKPKAEGINVRKRCIWLIEPVYQQERHWSRLRPRTPAASANDAWAICMSSAVETRVR